MGPALGGALAQPCDNYPTIFSRGTLFDRYPFLLPNLVCAIVLTIGVFIGILFLEETHGEKRYRRDLGVEVGRYILSRFGYRQPPVFTEKPVDINIEDYEILLEDEAPPGYRTTEGSPRLVSSRAQFPSDTCTGSKLASRQVLGTGAKGVRKAFTKQVILNIMAFGMLA